ncbi:MAG: ATP-grasp domain-containing protein [Patescibacteria group bacterium]|nr:ATP-grasp domain-containing protein [Patescibacteria group bacterium]
MLCGKVFTMNPLKETVVYISREIERTMGIEPSDNYRIVAGRTPYSESIKSRYPDFVTLIDGKDGSSAGTSELMAHPDTSTLISSLMASGKRPYIMVFKNTARIEPLARERGWTIINPPAETSEKIENKLSQVQWLGTMESYLPPHRLKSMSGISWKGQPFIVQWAHGHTGAGTILVESEETLKALQDRFPERRARVTEYVSGPSFTANIVVTPDKIEAGGISYQITGLAPFTDKRFVTIGNDWSIVKSLLSAADLDAVRKLVQELGARMQQEFWRGLFGIDMIKDEKTGKLYLIEVNARQPASTTYESALQQAERAKGADGLTTFEAHVTALLGQPLAKPVIEITDGAQIVQRVGPTVKSVPGAAVSNLEKAGFKTVSYGNIRDNEDLLRIQSPGGIMAGHGTFNESGQKIVGVLKDGFAS